MEFARIAAFSRAFPRVVPGADVSIGIGDDCAVVRVPRGAELCVTTDALVEDVHFTRAHFSPGDIGHKALAVNLSDLAAMGATPAWFVCALQLPPWVDDRVLRGLARGMSALARRHRVALVGGNLSAARELSIVLTVTGYVPRGRALTRGGARAGDILYVSGTLGDARRELEVMEKVGRAGPRQRRPSPRLRLGQLSRGFARAAIDVSDGLMQDLGHLCEASGVGAVVALDALPVSPVLRRAVGKDAAHYAAAGGEDYELVLAVPPRRAAAFEAACRRAKERVRRIGVLTSGRAVRLLDASGREVPLPPGFDHFVDPPTHHK